MLFIDRPISAESHALLPTPSPLSWINYAGIRGQWQMPLVALGYSASTWYTSHTGC